VIYVLLSSSIGIASRLRAVRSGF